ncbi:MAG: SirB2 family protein [Gammaproteobacteria bacterium]
MTMGIIKTIHVATALISITGFTIRGIWMLRDSPLLLQKWVRIVPHINDTVLLLSAIILAVQINQAPLVQGWLTAKVLGLLVYIGLGMVALRFGKTKPVKALAFLSAIVVFVYIVLVALTKNPLLSL